MSEELDITIAYQKVTELMSNYRETLLTLAGSFDKIDVPWNDTENYNIGRYCQFHIRWCCYLYPRKIFFRWSEF